MAAASIAAARPAVDGAAILTMVHGRRRAVMAIPIPVRIPALARAMAADLAPCIRTATAMVVLVPYIAAAGISTQLNVRNLPASEGEIVLNVSARKAVHRLKFWQGAA